ncbi:MAG TPA: extracellular solute-binding protein [Solirubrobacteraceae bacterium]|jgi:iron(III) transport system substrate-binding protein
MNIKLSLTAAFMALVLVGCGGSPGGSSPSGPLRGQSITLYSGQHEQTAAAVVEAFEKQTGVKVSIRSDDEAVLGNQISQEGANSPADVFYTENTPVLEYLQERGMLARLYPSTLAAIPREYHSPQGDWVGLSARISALVYNAQQISPTQLPSSILALAEPRWRGKLAISPSETDFQPLLTSIAKLDGRGAAEKWLAAVKANSKLYPDNETVVSQVNNGESTVGLINHYYWFRLRDEIPHGSLHSALHYYAPRDPGDLLNVSGAGVLKSSSHQAAAQAFVAFLASRAGQDAIAHSHSYEYPLRPGVSAATALRPFAQLKPAAVTPADLGDGRFPLELEQKLGLF